MSGAPGEPGAAAGKAKIDPKDVAAATAVGTAFKIGAQRHGRAAAQGAATGVPKPAVRRSGAPWQLALAVAAVTIGMLLLMIYRSP